MEEKINNFNPKKLEKKHQKLLLELQEDYMI